MTDINCPRCAYSTYYFNTALFWTPKVLTTCGKCNLKITGQMKPEDFYASVDLRKVAIIATAALSSIYYVFKCTLMLSQPWSILATALTGFAIWDSLRSASPAVMGPIENKISEKLVKPLTLRLFYDPRITAKA